MTAEIFSLRFELATAPPRSEFIIIPLDKPARTARADKSWIDVRAGDIIQVRGRHRIVKRVWPYRTTLCTSNHPVVTTARDWLETEPTAEGLGY